MMTPAADPGTASSATLVGTFVGPFRIVRRLGEGGMGRVYLGVSPSGRAVAVKILLKELLHEPDFRARFRAEIAAAQAVSGAFTAPIVDADPDATPPWFATVYIAGPSLHDAVVQNARLGEADFLLLAAGVSEALAAIHRAGRVHRDLTPANILLAEDGPRVIDFGISRVVDERGEAVPSGLVYGVSGYIAPERLRGDAATAATDIFSLGAVLAFATQGFPPCGTGPDLWMRQRTLNDPPRLDGVPQRFRDVVEACLAKDPALRPAAEDLPALFRRGAGAGWSAPAVVGEVHRHTVTLRQILGPAHPNRRKILIGGGALAVTAISGGLAALLTEGSTPKTGVGGTSHQTLDAMKTRWASSLARSTLAVRAYDAKTVVCTDRTGIASFDVAAGTGLWSDVESRGGSIITDGTTVYVVRSDGRTYAFDARTGNPVWASDTATNPDPRFVTKTDLVGTEASNLVRSINLTDGTTRWTHALANVYDVLDATSTGTVIPYLTNGTSWVYTVLDANSGRQRWTKPCAGLCAPATGDVYYALDEASMNLLALKAADGTQVWSKPTTLPSQAAPQTIFYTTALRLEQGILFCYPGMAGNQTGTGLLSAFDPSDGRQLWTVNPALAGDGTSGGYAIVDQTVCYLDGVLKAINARHGTPLWTAGNDLGQLQLGGAVGGFFVAAALDADGGQAGLYGWEARTGKPAWRFPVSDGTGAWTFLMQPNGLLASRNGHLFAFMLR
ncbi:outer membrane protein assembly factor BamB [Catenulispora sp. GAS73]|uniref:serine/threonine-protein kinase n=1 Tax=Catenulispora sp. GAS73 TaxID=3156269 RepID=UPI003514D6F0